MNQILKDPLLRDLSEANPVLTARLTTAESERSEVVLKRIVDRTDGAHTTAFKMKVTPAKLAWRIGAAATTVVAAVTATFLVGAPASAEDVLLEAASSAAVQPVPDGQFWYVRSEVDGPEFEPYGQETWLSKTSGVMRDESLIRNFDLTPESGWMLFGDGLAFTWDELEQLPTDADALRQVLVDGVPSSGHGADFDLWTEVVSLLEASPASPQLRRALWEVLATVRDVELLGTVTDHAGRQGTAVRSDFSDRRLGQELLVLNSADGTVLETVRVADGEEWRNTVLEQGPRATAPLADPPICGPGSIPEVSC